MHLRYSFRTALRGLMTNRTRSFLTILGIVIGIASIIMVMSLGEGARSLVLGQLEGLGSLTVVVLPGKEPTGPSSSAQTFSDSLKERDLLAIAQTANVPGADVVMPIVFGGATGVYANETYRLTIFGGSARMAEMFDLETDAGSFFTEEEVRARADVVVIGSKIKDELFGQDSAVGKRIRIKDRNFRIIGVLKEEGQSSYFNFDDVAIVPVTTAQQYVLGVKYYHRIFLRAVSEDQLDNVVSDVEKTLRASHRITDPEDDDFFVSTQADLAERLGSVTTVLALFLSSVASISLFVGGIGIMNIMLVSVTERTREIGLRKALGATNTDIMRQFLLEAVLLTVIGGVVGILLGSSLSYVTSILLSSFVASTWVFAFPYGAAALGFVTAACIGLVFGLYPARKASQKSPMEALRYE